MILFFIILCRRVSEIIRQYSTNYEQSTQSLTIFFRNILSHKISDRLFQHSFTKSHRISSTNSITKYFATNYETIFHQVIHQVIHYKISTTTSSQQFWYRTSSQLHFNKLHRNNFDIELHHNFISTNSSTIIVTDLQQTLLITNFHNIIQELEGYSSHTFTTYFIDNKHQYSFMWQIIHHILSQHYHKLFIEYFNKFQHIFNTSSSCVNKFINKFQQDEWV